MSSRPGEAAFLCAALVAGVLAFAAPDRPRVPVLLDTDIGAASDDALALALALQSPELDLRGVTTVAGDAHTRALLACRLLQAVGRTEVPIAAGAPARAVPDRTGQMRYGLRHRLRKRPEPLPAVEFLYRELKARPGELTVLALGPLTNVAGLLARHPDCKPWVKRLVVMGGALRVGYDGKPPAVPEWNIKSDIPAARAVFSAGLPLVLVPLDATAGLKLEGPRLRQLLTARTPLAKQLQALHRLADDPTPTLYDPLAVALCFDESFCRLEELRVEVDGQGRTRVVPGRANTRVATATRGEAFLNWYINRLAPAAPGGSGPGAQE
jgi:inosine-uridine nucleoside N-ribohydrolase